MRDVETCGGFLRRTWDGAFLLIPKNVSGDASSVTWVRSWGAYVAQISHARARVAL